MTPCMLSTFSVSFDDFSISAVMFRRFNFALHISTSFAIFVATNQQMHWFKAAPFCTSWRLHRSRFSVQGAIHSKLRLASTIKVQLYNRPASRSRLSCQFAVRAINRKKCVVYVHADLCSSSCVFSLPILVPMLHFSLILYLHGKTQSCL